MVKYNQKNKDTFSRYLKILLEGQFGDINEKDSRGLAILHQAAELSDAEGIQALIAKEAEVNIKSDMGDTPLHLAALRGEVENIKALIEKGAEVNIRNDSGDTPLHEAAINGEVESIKELIKGGAEINAKNDGGCTALHRASFMGYEEAVKELISSGADVNIKRTPLHDAALMREVGNVRTILEVVENVNERDEKGCTPLHLVCLRAKGEKELKIVKELIRRGANTNVLCNIGKTPMDYARHNQEIMEVLKTAEIVNKQREYIKKSSRLAKEEVETMDE
ncbi:ankyrin repeat domain-containing protein [Wolbachia endosymbiont of Ctenocephalides felis wCfeJ]|uniref:ankyrin repeat domain-containing protein n=1 Tax=Wolbachia endosymbiont of Ctenocephalides felis wCfeJ TaxID=2732594 RepID=UPI0014450CD0|nr:ankyrin repeat domain-containing protein [Wolbachia endosymbiont of Ctenocephalides felis wCfeJ]WCR58317.1 MAG: Protein PhlB [Wolbachia endosymbiont of Ctenocephalides felis wCfeJ]